jgi:DNA methylase/Helicase conserved C-terminal domain/SNF2-related domain
VTDYTIFLQSKRITAQPAGFDVAADAITPALFSFQRDLIRWSARKGRAALFADTGLGKGLMALEWARLIADCTLIVAPLSVARQFIREAAKFGYGVRYARSQADVIDGITVTNYEMIEHFDMAQFSAIVLDESSILKALDGKTRQKLTEMCAGVPYRLCCTATPAPNDIAEIANHAEFLGVMTRAEMLSAFFVHDDQGWRLKGHAEQAFYRWLASWGMSVRKPSDLGYNDDGYILPPLTIAPLWVTSDYVPEGQLFFTGLKGIQDRTKVRKGTLSQRNAETAALVNASTEQWIVWCGLNEESAELARLIPDAIEVVGSDSADAKAAAIEAFQDGQYRVLITKPKIAGFGMNLQNCHRMAFCGLSDSWEAYYQCIRRCWRFGQTEPVEVRIVLSEHEEAIYHNVMQKELEAQAMSQKLIEHIQEFERQEIANIQDTQPYQMASAQGQDWQLLLGDSTERLVELADNSIDLSVHSPPFASLYTYSPSERDLGNSRDDEEFLTHYGMIIDHLLRVTKPGRIACVHVFDIPAMLVRDSYIGLKDFSGDVLRLFIRHGWIFDARIPIDKNQQAQSIRTHSKGLTMTQMEKDRSWSRPALPDYILKFRKPGENAVPVCAGDVTRDLWIEWANPTWPDEADRCADAGAFATWYGIRETDTLNVQAARESADERHICPLQLGTIERCIRLWSNTGETVFDPFAGIGSTGYEALRLDRGFVGIELKESYYRTAVRNLRAAEASKTQIDLFSMHAVEVA